MFENYEEFSENQLKILNTYVTNTHSNIFALRNLPEVIKGALFSRYSRSSLGLRTLLLKEFILSEDAEAPSFADNTNYYSAEDQDIAIDKARNFFDKILDGFGDDSVGELGGAHIGIERVSMLAAKFIEDCRIGGSPLEKSTRYVYFDQKVNGEYLFYREPILMTSAFRDLYLNTCNYLFDTYSKLIPPLTLIMEKKFPKEQEVSKPAYTATIRSKVLDCLRGILPAGTLTNLGLYGNGRFFEYLIQKLHSSSLAETQEIGKSIFEELSKIIPSFIKRSQFGQKYQQTFARFREHMLSDLKDVSNFHAKTVKQMIEPGVKLIHYDSSSVYRVAAALIFPFVNCGLKELQDYCSGLSYEELSKIFDSVCNHRENRRHKSPRALEHAEFTFEILADFGVYRDLQRHRMVTQDRQLLTCNFGYFMPPELIGTEMEKDYRMAMDTAKKAFDKISLELPEEAQYVVPMAYNIHWHFRVNLRSLQWLCELRSAPAGHSTYRAIVQEMAKQVGLSSSLFEKFFGFVDFNDYEFGRLGQEIKIAEKKNSPEVVSV